jgi:cytochrome P450
VAPQLPSASLLENARFNQAVIVPGALQGLFKRRPRAVGVATRVGVDGQAVSLLAGMRRAHGAGPVWVRVMKDPALLLLDVADVRRALEGSPHPFASDPAAKRDGMGSFQPHALTLSSGELWEQRRRFTEAVLDSDRPAHALADRFVAVAFEEIERIGAGAGTDPEIDHDTLHAAYRRITRRVLFGDRAADDEALSDQLAALMEHANSLPGAPSDDYRAYAEHIEALVARAGDDSLAARAAQTPASPDVQPAGQFTHWLFALQDTTSVNVLRAVALLATHDLALERVQDELATVEGTPGGEDVAGFAYLRAMLLEAMRLWPTTPMLARETRTELVWDGVRVPAGTQVLIVNLFHHRDPERLGEAADHCTPEGWIDGRFDEDWGLNHLSHGPQGCPGANLALLIGTATLAALLRRGSPRLAAGALSSDGPLPHMLNPFALRIAFG